MATLQLNPIKERLIFLSPTVHAGKERECSLADFEILGGLGAGAFGKVYKVCHKTSKKIFALKQIAKKLLRDQMMVPQIKTEIKIMYSLDHNSIIRLFNHFEESDHVYLIIEFAQGGQLYEKLNKVGRFEERAVQQLALHGEQYIRDIVSALEYCHSRDPPIIHRDIKPENILLDENGKAKLADFGWSNFFNPETKRVTYCGTLDYLAPEMIMKSGHDVKLDVWSVGVLIFELLAGRAPFTPPSSVKDPREMQRILEENILKVKLDFPKDFPPLAKELVNKVLKKNPKSRMSISEMKNHPWLSLSVGTPKSKPDLKSPSYSFLPGFNESTGIKTITDIQTPSKPLQMSKGDEGWTNNELESYSSRKESIMNHSSTADTSREIEASPMAKTKTKADDIYERFSIKHKTIDNDKKDEIDDLNQMIKRLKSTIGEQEIALRNKTAENETLKKENERIKADITKGGYDPNNPSKAFEYNKFRLMEEANTKLKSELDDAYRALDEKEHTIQENKLELKEVEKYKKQVEKLKTEKSNLMEENRKLQMIISQSKEEIEDLKSELETSRQTFEKKLKEAEMRGLNKDGNQGTLKDFMEITKGTMDQMQKKVEYYKGKSESLEELQAKNNQLEKELIKLRVNSTAEIENTKYKLQEYYEAKLEELENKFREENYKLKSEVSKLSNQRESEMVIGRSSIAMSESNDRMQESMRNELKVAQDAILGLKSRIRDMEKISSFDKDHIKTLIQRTNDLTHQNEQEKKPMGQSNSNPQQSINEESMKKDEPEIIMKQVDRFIYDEKKDQIGKGVFALVYKGFDPENDNKEVAIKRISKRSIENYRDHQEIFLREINILSKLDHPYCIKLVKAFRTETGNIYIVTNFCNQGSLEQLLKRRKTLSEPEALTVVRQIAEAMCALERLEPENGEKKSVVLLHRDIKPANILLHDGECRLADFGFSKLVEKNNEGNSLKHTQLGTPTYMPPQLLDDKEYSEKCDIWATGVLLYQMLFGDIPWRGSTMYEIYDNIFDQPLKFPGTVQEKVKKLISAMLDTNEKERVSWKGILDHPAIRNKGPDVKIQQDEKHATISYISISTGTDSDTESVRW